VRLPSGGLSPLVAGISPRDPILAEAPIDRRHPVDSRPRCAVDLAIGERHEGVPLRDVRLAARHAGPRTTTIYDRRRQNFDRHAAYVVVTFVASD
jgi:hypothetical protein